MKNNDTLDSNLNFDTLTVTYDSDDSAVITIYPLERGFGHTLGALITKSLQKASLGPAVCGYMAAYTCKEEEDLITALRSIQFTVQKNIIASNLYILNVKPDHGSTIYAADFILPEGITIKNPDLPVITGYDLTCIYVRTGRGFISADEMKNRLPRKARAIDENHCTVDRTSYAVETVRSGAYIDRDRLSITVIPREGYTVKDAVNSIITELQAILEPMIALTDMAKNMEVFYKPNVPEKDENLDKDIEELIHHMSTRASNCLKRSKILTLSDLLALKREGLAAINGMGKTSIDDIALQLAKLGYYI